MSSYYHLQCIFVFLILTDRCEYHILLTLFKPEFTTVIFINYKPRIAVAIEVDEKLKKIAMGYCYWFNSFNQVFFLLKPLVVGRLSVFSGI